MIGTALMPTRSLSAQKLNTLRIMAQLKVIRDNNDLINEEPQKNMRKFFTKECKSKKIMVSTQEKNEDLYYTDYIMATDLLKKIDEIEQMGNNWDEEFQTPSPSKEVLIFSRTLVSELIKLHLIPYRIAPTIEEGICFSFISGDSRLYLELYNDGDIGYIAENIETGTVLKNEDITKEQTIPHLKAFFKK